MNGYRLCQTKMAEVPYYIENISTNIYSLEELCFYFQHNIYLLDETIINEGLCDWIRDELGQKQLYQRLYKEIENETGLANFILPVFREIGYLTHEEFRELNIRLANIQNEPEVARWKMKGDYLLDHGKYINALKVYQITLTEAKEGKLGGQFFGEIYHNMGCVHMRMFQYDEATECFRVANEHMRSEASMRDYLTAFYLTKPKEKFQREAESLNATAELIQSIEESVEMVKGSTAQKEIPQDTDEFLKKTAAEYHNSTGL